MMLQELFDVVICKNPISKAFADENPGNIPYVTTTSKNNGVECYVDYPPQYPANLITVSKDGASADAFLQTEPFCGNEKVMVLLNKQELSRHQLLFYTYVINANKYKFAYGRKCSVARLKELIIPAVEEIPKWLYATDISNVYTQNTSGIPHEITVESWKEFKISDLFIIRYGVNLELNICEEVDENEDGAINFVARTAENNGISARVKIKEGIEPQAPGLITVAGGGSVLSTFLQYEPFYSGRDLYTLESKDKISDAAKLFIVAVIEKNKYKYSYGRQANKTLPDVILKLPTKQDGSPDYDYMEKYMKSLSYGDRL